MTGPSEPSDAQRGIREIKPGIWEVRVHVGRDLLTGKIHQVSRTVRADRPRSGAVPKAARDLRAKILTEVHPGKLGATPATAGKATVGSLLDQWLNRGVERVRSPTTIAGYQRKIDSGIRPAPGNVPLKPLTPHLPDTRYGQLLRGGKSPAMVMQYHRILNAACNQAVRCGWLDVAPTSRATRPGVGAPELNVPSPVEVRMLIDLAATSKAPEMASVITLAASTGCGEENCAGFAGATSSGTWTP